ncbi:CTD kinase subunit gamma CTK3-domain-containing protein [Lentinula guzmanii]|uniref:CTD kinase subunit gamma CTK3-domain-containing protein n=3 Tax=Lentinula TaxID=5352 RepID=A0AA38MX75_9AGAR|nr:CTD kinase subunit gamma CTK3-domain-containing protein [Lentinula guzmanii]KAJ3747806.1 CTD kinase subunit gamma CTK3-domain-containing protein [Lentinula detonsa]KAJ3785808.1 CTD kinase subunit gamma CTK3-domain-containing protein [Lentinula aff. detonsa]KAJ3797637.1 CTD kinase subunit gamma CTK3-domain-containing protein [Lentinula aff. detonsa]KAJ3987077.1 CTD kinase subunit gamma CTK3-domain-containing protein [Lentinula detonsa]
MDPFEVRMQFVALLRRLDASQQSIRKVVSYAVKFFPPCGEDLWDCIVEETQKGSINSRINILYFLDSLCETCLLVKTHANAIGNTQKASSNMYVDLVARDLGKIVGNVVPPGVEGSPNLVSTKQILETWRSKRVIDPQILDSVITSFAHRNDAGESDNDAPTVRKTFAPLPRSEVFKRIEEDRERHKRLRERRWVQPITHNNITQMQAPPLASFMPLTEKEDGDRELSIDIEFDNEWETLSDWNEDDDEACTEENALCFPDPPGEMAMDLD